MNTSLCARYARYTPCGGCARAPASNMTGVRRNAETARATARRSAASSPRVELTNTRRRWSGVRIMATQPVSALQFAAAWGRGGSVDTQGVVRERPRCHFPDNRAYRLRHVGDGSVDDLGIASYMPNPSATVAGSTPAASLLTISFHSVAVMYCSMSGTTSFSSAARCSRSTGKRRVSAVASISRGASAAPAQSRNPSSISCPILATSSCCVSICSTSGAHSAGQRSISSGQTSTSSPWW